MHARIIAITQPLLNDDGDDEDIFFSKEDDDNYIFSPMLPEEFIAYVARVSNPSNQSNGLTAKKLLRYLAKNKHWSPFEMVNVVMEINTTRDIARQILRHRSFSFQEFSQRYADARELGQYVVRDARLQDTKNRQNSVDITDEYTITDPNTFAPLSLKNVWREEQEKLALHAARVYKWALDNGIAKEQARVVLPEGMTPSRLYMNGTLRSWITYIALREKNGTQMEHMVIAKECKSEIIRHFPSLDMLASEENGDWTV